MQEAHVLQFRLGAADNPEQGVVSGAVVDAALAGYLNQGWKVVAFQTAGANQYGAEIVILLVREAQAQAS